MRAFIYNIYNVYEHCRDYGDLSSIASASRDGYCNRTKSTTIIMTFLNVKLLQITLCIAISLLVGHAEKK